MQAQAYRIINYNAVLLTDPVSESDVEEDESERIIHVNMVTTSPASTATAAAVYYAVAMTTSTIPLHRDPAVVEIDVLDTGYSLAELYSGVLAFAVWGPRGISRASGEQAYCYFYIADPRKIILLYDVSPNTSTSPWRVF